jgi:hypothetical protein
VHTHGHKATITHYDGVEHNPIAQITRDVYDLAPVQRIDLSLSTKDDGLHSYGEGIWIFHDHREKGITTNGMNPGGNVSAIVYSKFLDKMGMPQAQGVDLTPYFTKEFYQGRIPVWQDADDLATLGAVETDPGVGIDPASVKKPKSNAPASNSLLSVFTSGTFVDFLLGLLLGVGVYLLRENWESVGKMVRQGVSSVKGPRGES